MAKKILILSASPIRDRPIDELIASELRKMGNEVWVGACLQEGRSMVLELEPDVVVIPPIRNPHSRDLAETLKSWGIGVVSRHTEASMDWQDFKRMDNNEKASNLGRWAYNINLEIVWGDDEAEILRRRGFPFPIEAVGSFSADAYKSKEMLRQCVSKKFLFEKHKLNPKKRTILVLCAWGFMDSAPDLRVDEIIDYQHDKQGRDKWLQMITGLQKEFGRNYNILATLHPNVATKPYKDYLDQLKTSLDIEYKAIHLVKNCDIVIHAGSTTAMGAHFLKKPAFQYGDQNQSKSWFDRSESPLSHISPYAKNISQLIDYIKKCEFDKSNANTDSIKALRNGRYGKMDGKAYRRAAELINKIGGKFKMCWPKAHRDYDQILTVKDVSRILKQDYCGICKNTFFTVQSEWLGKIQAGLKLAPEQAKILPNMKHNACPHCAAKYYERSSYNPSAAQQSAAAVQEPSAPAEKRQ